MTPRKTGVLSETEQLLLRLEQGRQKFKQTLLILEKTPEAAKELCPEYFAHFELVMESCPLHPCNGHVSILFRVSFLPQPHVTYDYCLQCYSWKQKQDGRNWVQLETRYFNERLRGMASGSLKRESAKVGAGPIELKSLSGKETVEYMEYLNNLGVVERRRVLARMAEAREQHEKETKVM